MARPKKYDIDTEEVQKLAKYGMTNVEIADFFGCDESLIRKSYSEYLTKGSLDGITEIIFTVFTQYKIVLTGINKMLKLLSATPSPFARKVRVVL